MASGSTGRGWRALTPRGRLVALGALVLLGGGLAAAYPVLVGLGGVLLAVALLELASVLRAPSVQVVRHVAPLVVRRFDRCVGHLRLSGGRPPLMRVAAVDLVDGHPVPIPGDAHAGVEYVIPTPRRGLVDVGPVRLLRTGPLGLASRIDTVGDVRQVRVLPRALPMHARPVGRFRAAAATTTGHDPGGTDLADLHEYRPGDDLRRLHWASSARTGTLMVREDTEPARPSVLLLLDDRAAGYTAAGDFEDAVEVAAALARLVVDAGDRLDLVSLSGRHRLEVPPASPDRPAAEALDVERLLTEVALDPDTDVLAAGTPSGYDVALVVTGAPTTPAALQPLLPPRAETSVLVVTTEGPRLHDEGGTTVLRGPDAPALAETWDRVPR